MYRPPPIVCEKDTDASVGDTNLRARTRYDAGSRPRHTHLGIVAGAPKESVNEPTVWFVPVNSTVNVIF